ncbi:hypothetical protein [Halomarina oriensis]|uniref:HD domain-containing protein n=1 Tax=Halomarina oriensis TaxID=671145 RepID=A0A6B0GNY2_9EURY|nr:hypothetical protein [Halomarina oriensis]MWG36504.1 hypothetical protein [Halomarina oriensis]
MQSPQSTTATQLLDAEDVVRRLPSIERIENDAIRAETIALTARAPAYFWRVPASTSGYHHPQCRGEHGLWIHTLMLGTALERLAPTYVGQERLTGYDIDCARAAVILHDQRKNGSPETPQAGATDDHDLRMARVIRRESTLPRRVARAVETHMGAWYAGPRPLSDLEDLVHTADMMASTETITCAVDGPLPEELAGRDLQVVE